MPLSGHCPSARSTASLDGYLLLAPGVSTVRYPIPQRTFKYVATVQSVTDETCHNRILLVNPTLIDPEMQDCNPVSLNRNNRASFLHDAPAELGDAHRSRSRDWRRLGYCNTGCRSGATAVIWIMNGLKRSRVRFAPTSSAAGRDARSAASR